MAPAAAGQNPIPEEVAPFVSEVKPVPLKGKPPTQQQADIFRQMGVASPAGSVKPMGKILGATLEPLPKQSFPRISNGESAARYQLSSQGNYGINDLRSIALQRGLPVSFADNHQTLINRIMDSMTEPELERFEDAAVQQNAGRR